VERIAFFVATFPQPSETFLRREMLGLHRDGCRVLVCALRKADTLGPTTGEAQTVPCSYRPARASWRALISVAWLVLWRPVGLMRLIAYIWRLGRRGPRWALQLVTNLHAVAYFARIIERTRVQQVHGYFMNAPAVIAVAVSRVLQVPLTLAGHACDVFVEPAPLSVLIDYARLIRACNVDAAEQLLRASPDRQGRKVQLIHHGLDVREWCPAQTQVEEASSEVLFLSAGRFVEKKGFRLLLESWALVHASRPSLHLVLAGDGPLAPTLHRLVKEKRLSDCVCLPGWLQQSQLRQLLRRARAVVIPSIVARDGDRDGIPNILLEGGACGVPAVVSPLPGLCEVVRHERNGLVCEPDDPDSLAQAVLRLANDPALSARLGATARATVERDFDAATCVRRVRAFFDEAQPADGSKDRPHH